MDYYISATLFSVLLLPGVFATLVPFLPALFYMFCIALLFGVVDSFHHIHLYQYAVLAGVVLVSFINDQLAGVLGAKHGGAHRRSIVYGLIGTAIGFLLLPPFGNFLGLAVGVTIGEYLQHKKPHHISRAVKGALLGALTGMMIDFFLAIVFFVLFVSYVW
jgi:uncharacterized protein